MKKILALFLAVVLMLSISCAAFADVKANKEYTIAFSLKTVTNDAFQQAIAEAVENAATEAGCKFQLVTAGTETGVAIQVNQLEDLITAGVDALVGKEVHPHDGEDQEGEDDGGHGIQQAADLCKTLSHDATAPCFLEVVGKGTPLVRERL